MLLSGAAGITGAAAYRVAAGSVRIAQCFADLPGHSVEGVGAARARQFPDGLDLPYCSGVVLRLAGGSLLDFGMFEPRQPPSSKLARDDGVSGDPLTATLKAPFNPATNPPPPNPRSTENDGC